VSVRALVRRVPASFSRALSAKVPEPPIDVALAASQHDAYVRALRAAGATVEYADSLDESPDAVFVEDTAVVVGARALVTRPGAPSRRDETETVARVLGRDLEIVRMAEPAALDGGDCLFAGGTLFVGRSARTNAAGVECLRRTFTVRVVEIAMPPNVLHLKCVCSPLGADRMLLADQSLDPSVFSGLEIVRVPVEETYAANAVAIGDYAIVAEGHPRTAEAIERAGFRPLAVPTSEVRKADGSLTCQSIVYRALADG
jgi:dimethylargininase